MSHSTHVGFSCPPICSLNGREFRSIVSRLALPLFQSRAVGVANAATFTAWPSVSPKPFPFFFAAFSFSLRASIRGTSWHSNPMAVGVGHIVAATASTNDPLRPLLRNRSAISGVGVDAMHLSAVGVGNCWTNRSSVTLLFVS